MTVVTHPRRTGLSADAFRLLGASAVAIPHTGDANEFLFAQVRIPAGSMGPNGLIRFWWKFSHSDGTSLKTLKARFGPAGTVADSLVLAGSSTSMIASLLGGIIWNRNSVSAQLFGPNNSLSLFGLSTVADLTGAVNTAADCWLSFCGVNADAADTLTLDAYMVEVLHQP